MCMLVISQILLESCFGNPSLALLHDGIDERSESPADEDTYVVTVLQIQCGLANETDALWCTCHDD